MNLEIYETALRALDKLPQLGLPKINPCKGARREDGEFCPLIEIWGAKEISDGEIQGWGRAHTYGECYAGNRDVRFTLYHNNGIVTHYRHTLIAHNSTERRCMEEFGKR